MRILWLSHIVPYPPKGGVLQRSHHLLRQLAQLHDVHLLSFIQREPLLRIFGDLRHGIDESQTRLGEFCPVVRFVPIPSEQRPYGKQLLLLKSLFTPDPYSINWLKAPQFATELAGLMSSHRYNLVHFDTISLAVYRSQVDAAVTVLNHHNIESHMMLRRAGNERSLPAKAYLYYEGWRLRRQERRLCPSFDAHVTCSDLDSERLRAVVPGAETFVVPNGVDVDYFRPANGPDRAMRLVFAGRLSAYSNRQAVLFLAEQIWPRLRQAFPDLVVDVIGADPPPALLELAARDPGFRVHGFVDDVRPYLDQAWIYICPIRDGGGTKLKILDALAMAKPLVADPIACEGISVAPEETVLFASTPDEYVAQIGRLLADDRLRARMAVAGRRLVETRYSYAAIGEDLSRLYQRLAARRVAPAGQQGA